MRKKLSFILIALFLVNLFYQPYKNFKVVQAQELNSRYTVSYDYQTNVETTSYDNGLIFSKYKPIINLHTEYENQKSINTRAINGTDDRHTVGNTTNDPWNKIVYITNSYGYFIGTGFVIGPNTIATAAHVVCTHVSTNNFQWTSFGSIIPAKNGSTNPYGAFSVVFAEAGGNYCNNGNFEDDWGIIRVNGNIGDTVGLSNIGNSIPLNVGAVVYSAGYTDVYDLDYLSGVQLLEGWGTISGLTSRMITGNWDMTAGQSGGPTYVYVNNVRTIVGINSNGGIEDNTFSASVYIDNWIYDKFNSYRTLRY